MEMNGLLNQQARDIAGRLDYQQRKAVRRLARGQKISAGQTSDPLIQQLTSTDHYPVLEIGADMAEWCDWYFTMIALSPRLTDLGRAVFEALDHR